LGIDGLFVELSRSGEKSFQKSRKTEDPSPVPKPRKPCTGRESSYIDVVGFFFSPKTVGTGVQLE